MGMHPVFASVGNMGADRGFDSIVIWKTAGSARAIFEVQHAHRMNKDGDQNINNRVNGGKSKSLTKSAHNTIHTLCTTNGSPYQSECGALVVSDTRELLQ